MLCVMLLRLAAGIPPALCWPSGSALAFGRLSGMQGWKASHFPQKGSKELFSLTFWKEVGRREEEEGQNRRRVWAVRPPWGLPAAGGGFRGWSLRTCCHHDVRVYAVSQKGRWVTDSPRLSRSGRPVTPALGASSSCAGEVAQRVSTVMGGWRGQRAIPEFFHPTPSLRSCSHTFLLWV